MTKRNEIRRRVDIKYDDAACLIQKINEISEKYQTSKDEIIVDYNTYEDYDCVTVEVYLEFYSPETDEEMEARIKREKAWAKQVIDNERQQYELLKKKFESI